MNENYVKEPSPGTTPPGLASHKDYHLTDVFSEGRQVPQETLKNIYNQTRPFEKAPLFAKKSGTLLIEKRHFTSRKPVLFRSNTAKVLYINHIKKTGNNSEFILQISPLSGKYPMARKPTLSLPKPLYILYYRAVQFFGITNNQIHSQGYFKEIAAFVDSIEGKAGIVLTGQQSIKDTYKLISTLKKRQHLFLKLVLTAFFFKKVCLFQIEGLPLHQQFTPRLLICVPRRNFMHCDLIIANVYKRGIQKVEFTIKKK